MTGRDEERGWESQLCNFLTALSAVDNGHRVCVPLYVSICVCGLLTLTLKLDSVFAADLANTQTEGQTRTYSHCSERCVVSDLEMITILLNRSFHSHERVCNEKGKQRETFLSLFALFIMNRVVSQSWPCMNNAPTQIEACICN